MADDPPALLAVIVHFGDISPTLEAVASLAAQAGLDAALSRFDWVVVDNGPRRPNLRLEETVRSSGGRYLPTERNEGFFGGVFAALGGVRRESFPELLLILNHDVRLEPDTVALLVARIVEDPLLGVVGPAILDAQTGLLWNAGSAIEWPRCRPRSLLHNRPAAELPGEPYPADFLCGCALLVRTATLSPLPQSLREYFLYFEDAELSYAVRERGWRIEVVPRARVLHRAGSAASREEQLVQRYRVRNRIRFSRRWAPPGIAPRFHRWLFALQNIVRGGARLRGALDGLFDCLAGRGKPSR